MQEMVNTLSVGNASVDLDMLKYLDVHAVSAAAMCTFDFAAGCTASVLFHAHCSLRWRSFQFVSVYSVFSLRILTRLVQLTSPAAFCCILNLTASAKLVIMLNTA